IGRRLDAPPREQRTSACLGPGYGRVTTASRLGSLCAGRRRVGCQAAVDQQPDSLGPALNSVAETPIVDSLGLGGRDHDRQADSLRIVHHPAVISQLAQSAQMAQKMLVGTSR